MIECTGIQFLKHQILIQISYWNNLIPRNFAIAELLTKSRHSGFWHNEHVLSCFTMLVTVSKAFVFACTCTIVRNIKTLTIMLEVEGAMQEVQSISSLPRRKKEDLIEGFKIIWFIINNFFVSFEISGGSCNLSQNTLRLMKKSEKCILSFMESIIADFIQVFSAIVKFLFLQGRLVTRLCVHSISWFYQNLFIF